MWGKERNKRQESNQINSSGTGDHFRLPDNSEGGLWSKQGRALWVSLLMKLMLWITDSQSLRNCNVCASLDARLCIKWVSDYWNPQSKQNTETIKICLCIHFYKEAERWALVSVPVAQLLCKGFQAALSQGPIGAQSFPLPLYNGALITVGASLPVASR